MPSKWRSRATTGQAWEDKIKNFLSCMLIAALAIASIILVVYTAARWGLW